MERIYLSLGSNLGDRLENLRQAVASLGESAEVVAVSDGYESEPVDVTEQPWFLNAVAELRMNTTPDDNSPEKLLERVLAIERALGRQRDTVNFIPKGPRIIDIDIVLFGNRVINAPALTVPHPAMHLRRFVLQPMAQIAPAAEHPVLHQSALELLRALPENGPVVRRLSALGLPRQRLHEE